MIIMSLEVPTIQENDQVIVCKGKNLKVIQVRKGRQIWMEKISFTMDAAIGEPYGSSFQAQNKVLVKMTNENEEDTDKTEEISEDNRNLKDTTENQKLSKAEIQSLKKEGITGQEIVDRIVENSATFKSKTEYSQQKYLNKKKKKHVPIFTILKPTTRLLAEMYYNKGPARICNLRLDSMSQLLLQANVRASCKMMVVESCIGLLVGAVMERMAGHGTLVQLYGGSHPVKQAIEAYNFPQSYLDILHFYPLNRVSQLKHTSSADQGNTSVGEAKLKDSQKSPQITTESEKPEAIDDNKMESETHFDSTLDSSVVQGEKRKLSAEEDVKDHRKVHREQQLEQARQLILKADMDGLIIACKYHPAPILMSLIDYVAQSRPIVIFCQTREPLIECYGKMRDRGGVVNMRITETWWREHQVLPGRSHPAINMDSASGYLLCGTKVALK